MYYIDLRISLEKTLLLYRLSVIGYTMYPQLLQQQIREAEKTLGLFNYIVTDYYFDYERKISHFSFVIPTSFLVITTF